MDPCRADCCAAKLTSSSTERMQWLYEGYSRLLTTGISLSALVSSSRAEKGPNSLSSQTVDCNILTFSQMHRGVNTKGTYWHSNMKTHLIERPTGTVYENKSLARFEEITQRWKKEPQNMHVSDDKILYKIMSSWTNINTVSLIKPLSLSRCSNMWQTTGLRPKASKNTMRVCQRRDRSYTTVPILAGGWVWSGH